MQSFKKYVQQDKGMNGKWKEEKMKVKAMKIRKVGGRVNEVKIEIRTKINQ